MFGRALAPALALVLTAGGGAAQAAEIALFAAPTGSSTGGCTSAGGFCSLPRAIELAEARPPEDRITINLFPGTYGPYDAPLTLRHPRTIIDGSAGRVPTELVFDASASGGVVLRGAQAETLGLRVTKAGPGTALLLEEGADARFTTVVGGDVACAAASSGSVLRGSVCAAPQGTGVRVAAGTTLDRTSAFGGTGAGIDAPAGATVRRSAYAGSPALSGGVTPELGSQAAVPARDWQDAAAGDLHLRAGSPLVDALPATQDVRDVDFDNLGFDGDGPLPDVGADERFALGTTVETLPPVVSAGTGTASLVGRFTEQRDGINLRPRFAMGTSPDALTRMVFPSGLDSGRDVTALVGGLQAATTYYVRAEVVGSGQVARGPVLSFVIAPGAASDLQVDEITATSAQLSADFDGLDQGGDAVFTVQPAVDDPPPAQEVVVGQLGGERQGPQRLSTRLTGLTPGQLYSVVAAVRSPRGSGPIATAQFRAADATVTPPGPPAPAPPGPPVPPAPSPVDPVLCGQRITLLDVLPEGRRVRLSGLALPAYAGQVVRLLRGAQEVGRARVGPDGDFTALVAAPPPADRPRVRFVAVLPGARSTALRLARRLVLTARRGRRISGRVIAPAGRRPTTISVSRLLSCTSERRVQRVRLRRDGTFTVTLGAPEPGERFAYFRVRAGLGRSRTFSLPIAVRR